MTRAICAALLVFVVSACAGTRARTSVLLPAMKQSWPQVQALAMLAVSPEDKAVVVAFDEAMKTGVITNIVAVPFEPVRQLALQGVQIRLLEGTLGNFGAGSYRENIKLFNSSYLMLVAGAR